VKASEIRALTEDQLQDRLSELHKEWQDLRFQEAIGKLVATARIGQIRKDIARIHTIRTEREIDAALRQTLASGSSAS
jgi:large subunit ribosomal protein L29